MSFGFGGVLTEDWARELRQSLLLWPVSLYTPQEALEELRDHWLGKILLGTARNAEALTNEDALAGFLEKLWQLDSEAEQLSGI